MRLSTKGRTTSDDVRKVVLAALATALDNRKAEAKKKPGLTGVRAVATGAVIYTAGKAAFSGRRFIKERLGADGRSDESDDRREDEEYEDEEYDEPRAEEEVEPEDEEYEDEGYDEPQAEEEEESEDEEYEEPQAEEEDDEPEDEEDEEPRAEADEEPEDEEPEEPRAEEDEEPEEEKPRVAPPSRRPPAHAKRKPKDSPIAELPSRPSRSRSPVGRA